jgi:hypothetical protein
MLQAYFAAKVLVSRLVAIIGPAFRSLWRESGMAGILIKIRFERLRADRHEPQQVALRFQWANWAQARS